MANATTRLLMAGLVIILPVSAVKPHQGPGKAEVQAGTWPGSAYGFSTAKCTIMMRVSFPAPYEGKRLVVYRSTQPEKEDCLPIQAGASGCVENFVGALAFVAFTVNRNADGKAAVASIREVVTLAGQSPGLPRRPPYTMSIKLANGMGSDVQLFGYDESPLPSVKRAAERDAAKAAWRRYRQELYLDDDRQPFAVIEWLHTTTRIRILRVDAPPSTGLRRFPRSEFR
jgi:hypothetical protein